MTKKVFNLNNTIPHSVHLVNTILRVLSDNALTCPCSYTDDKNRDDIDPDKLKNGVTDYPSPEDKEILYMFFTRYV